MALSLIPHSSLEAIIKHIPAVPPSPSISLGVVRSVYENDLYSSIFFLILSKGPCVAQECPEFVKMRSNEHALAQFLQNQESARRFPECTILVLRRLGDLNYDGKSMKGGLGTNVVAELLTEYLDFERPRLEFEPLGVGGNSELYPAVPALVEIGSAAQPALLKAITNEKTSDVARENAVTVMMYLHRENQAMAAKAIKMAARNEQNVDAAGRLRQASNEAAERCNPAARSECQRIISQQ
jgi:hypothetical protein